MKAVITFFIVFLNICEAQSQFQLTFPNNTNSFEYIFNYQDTIYAIKQNGLYKTPCIDHFNQMEFVHGVTFPISNNSNYKNYFNNLGDILYFQKGDSHFVSQDFGKTWSLIPFKNVFLDFENLEIYGYEVEPNGNLIISKSDKYAQSWQLVNTPFTSPFTTPVRPVIVAIGDTIFLALKTTAISSIPIHYTLDGGLTWNPFYLENINPFSYVHAIEITEKTILFSVISGSGYFYQGEYLFDYQGNYISKIHEGSNWLEFQNRFKNGYWISAWTNTNGGDWQKLLSLESCFPINFPNPLNGLYAYLGKQFGVSDNYIYFGNTIFELAKNKKTYVICDTSIVLDSVSYELGWHIISQTNCQVDSVILIKQNQNSFIEFINPEIQFCQGDTVFNLNHIISTDTILRDTIFGIASECDSIIITPFVALLNQCDTLSIINFCQGDSFLHNGISYVSDTTLVNFDSSTLCLKKIQKLHRLDFVEAIIDTTSFHPIQIYGYTFTHDTTITYTTPYQNHPCDSILQTINIHIQTSTINEKTTNSAIQIFPNPTSREINIQWPNGTALVQILNAQSQVLLEKKGHKTLKFNLSEFGSGIYFAKVKLEEFEDRWYKIVVLK